MAFPVAGRQPPGIACADRLLLQPGYWGGCHGFKELKGDTGVTGTRVSPRGPWATDPTAAGMVGVCPLGWTRGDGVPAVPPSKALSPSGVGRCAGGTLGVQGARVARLCPQLLGEAGGAHRGAHAAPRHLTRTSAPTHKHTASHACLHAHEQSHAYSTSRTRTDTRKQSITHP